MTQVRNEVRRAARSRCCKALDRRLDPELFRALGDPHRLDMLVRLSGCSRPCTVSEIASCFEIDLSVVSRHLRALRDAEVLTSEKRGKEVYYEVDRTGLAARLRAIAEALDACCDATS